MSDPITSLPRVWSNYRTRLAGSWQLRKFEIWDISGPERQLVAKPHGDNPAGRCVITPGQFMSAQLTPPSVMKPYTTGADLGSASDEEVAARVRGMSFYCGHFELYEDEKGDLVFVTDVELACDTSRLGGKQLRRLEYWEEEGKAFMLLRPINKVQGTEPGVKEGFLTWEKFESM